MPNHGEAQNTLEVKFRDFAEFRQLSEGDGAMDGNFECNFVFVDCVEARSVQL